MSIINIESRASKKDMPTKLKELLESSASPINLTLTLEGSIISFFHCLKSDIFSSILKSSSTSASITKFLDPFFLLIE